MNYMFTAKLRGNSGGKEQTENGLMENLSRREIKEDAVEHAESRDWLAQEIKCKKKKSRQKWLSMEHGSKLEFDVRSQRKALKEDEEGWPEMEHVVPGDTDEKAGEL